MDFYTIATATIADYQRTADTMALEGLAKRLHKRPANPRPGRDVPHAPLKPAEPLPQVF